MKKSCMEWISYLMGKIKHSIYSEMNGFQPSHFQLNATEMLGDK